MLWAIQRGHDVCPYTGLLPRPPVTAEQDSRVITSKEFTGAGDRRVAGNTVKAREVVSIEGHARASRWSTRRTPYAGDSRSVRFLTGEEKVTVQQAIAHFTN